MIKKLAFFLCTTLLTSVATATQLTPEQQIAKERGMTLYNQYKAISAEPYLKIAAEAGDRESQYFLGEALRLNNRYMTTEAQKWYIAAAEQGDPIALEAFRFTGEMLGRALADVVTVTSPEAIFLFGGLSKAGKLIFEPTQWYMEENMLFAFKNKVKLLPSGIQGKNAAILGASALIWQQENK